MSPSVVLIAARFVPGIRVKDLSLDARAPRRVMNTKCIARHVWRVTNENKISINSMLTSIPKMLNLCAEVVPNGRPEIGSFHGRSSGEARLPRSRLAEMPL